MAKYQTLVNGYKRLLSFITISAGVADADKPIATNAQGRIDLSFMPIGVGPDIKILPASENLAAGNPVNIWDDAGTLKVRKADATSRGKLAHGFVLAGVISGGSASIYPEGINNQATGLVPGPIFLSETAGVLTQDPATIVTAGSLIQCVGYMLSSTEMSIEIEADPVQI